jgi:hypothetical protein
MPYGGNDGRLRDMRECPESLVEVDKVRQFHEFENLKDVLLSSHYSVKYVCDSLQAEALAVVS